MPPTIEAFFTVLLAIPLYLNLYLCRLWNGAADPSLGKQGAGHRVASSQARANPAAAPRQPSP